MGTETRTQIPREKTERTEIHTNREVERQRKERHRDRQKTEKRRDADEQINRETKMHRNKETEQLGANWSITEKPEINRDAGRKRSRQIE